MVVSLVTASPVWAVNRTWTGQNSANWGTNNNWSLTGSIVGNDAFFGNVSSSGTTLNNDTAANSIINSITFNSGALTYIINGNAINLGGNNANGAITNNSTATQTINFQVNLAGNAGDTRTFDAAAGNLVFGNVLNNANAKNFNITGAFNTTINGNITQGGTITLSKSGTGTLTLAGANTYSGTTSITAGAVTIKNNTALGTTALGTSVASGAVLRVDGSSANLAVGAEALTLNGTGLAASPNGALRNIGGTNTWAGALTLGSASSIQSDLGSITFNGGLTNAGFLLTVQGAGNTAFNTTGISGNGGLTKTGDGTLTLGASNGYTGATTVNGGTLQVNGSTATGSAVEVNNAAILRGTGTVGGAVTLKGTSSLQSTGTLTLSNGFTASGSTNSITSGTIAGNGTVNSSTSLKLGTTATVNGSLAVNGSLSGTGTVMGALTGSGSVEVGNSPGILTASTVDSAGLEYMFEFTSTGSPNYSSASASDNDLLRLTSATPFTSNLASSNLVNIYLNVATLSAGDIFRGGFYTDNGADFLGNIQNATFVYYLFNGSGAEIYNGVNYDLYTGPLGINVSTVADTADFGNGDISGYVTQFSVVPEPTAALLGSLGMLLLLRRRRA